MKEPMAQLTVTAVRLLYESTISATMQVYADDHVRRARLAFAMRRSCRCGVI